MSQSARFTPATTRSALAALLIGATLALAPLTSAPAMAQSQLTVSSNQYGITQNVKLQLNKSMIVDLPGNVSEVVVSQPEVAGAIMRSSRRAIIQGVGGGETNILFLDASGRTISVLELQVIKEPSQIGAALQAALTRIIPTSNITVESVNLGGDTNRVVLTGSVRSDEDRQRAAAVAVQFAGDEKNVANILDVDGPQQVMLQVTVSEVKRTTAKQLGVNLSGSLSIGSANFGFNNTMSTSANNMVSGAYNSGGLQINAAITALEDRNALRVLAKPTLTALSGQPAEFKAGGEFPIPISDGNGGTTIQYKDYGVKLNFTPTVRSNGTIGLEIDTGVSELQAGSYTLTNRNTKTSVEIRPGDTLAIGGLLQSNVGQQIKQLPGLGNIPILGALFRSRDYNNDQTELVILVTPYLAQPSPIAAPLPTDRSVVAGDAEAIFLGNMETMYGVGNGGGMRGSFKGSVGFVLD
ncbi:type II and III secretion system protein family protein [Devosia rhodophyticola]|uniref:Type II and III secretion system protein family protein n=1 Tax=Devosia rhodophyticola TaxID=3026423 RepID=A0ABY7YZT8_9HYPH|nr:type II and III secretion system protein family protein [Devosia rhodophyticola]WDR06772.1 type II and III secretion system protein family protein [Devosia rhodophyticola]